MTTDGRAQGDGRHRRSDASRAAIVEALLALVAEGHIAPPADLVAARAGVSHRTVFRHFADMEALFAGMADRLAREYDGWQAPFAGRDWRERLSEMITRRARTYERLLPYKRAADAHRHRSAEIQRRHDRLLARMRERLIALLPIALTADPLRLEFIDLLLSFETWQRLRDEQRLDTHRAEQLVRSAVMQIGNTASISDPEHPG